MQSKINQKLLLGLSLLLAPTAGAWTDYLDGSILPSESPTRPWVVFTQPAPDEEPGETVIIEFQDTGGPNQAMRLNSGKGAHEWYLELFQQEEVVVGARFRLVEFSETGKENLISITTRSKNIAPAPSITLVDGRLKLWTYVNEVVKDQEIMDLGPAEANVWHTVYMSTRSDGWTKLWWDGNLVFDDYAPLSNPFNGYVEWGSGSWQYDAEDVVDFDWFGSGTVADLPVAITSSPAHGAILQDPAAGFSFNVVSQPSLAPGVTASGIALLVNGVDRTSSLTITGDDNNRQAKFTGLVANRFYKMMIQVTDKSGKVHKLPVEFDTFGANHFTFEAEDYNFDGGGFIDNVVLSSSEGPDNYLNRIGVEGIDHYELSPEPGTNNDRYRLDSTVGTQRNLDPLRPKYVAAQVDDPQVADYNVGWVEPTEWLNYTRTFPAGNYYLFGRFAANVGQNFIASVDKVTNPTTDQQTTTPLGSFKGGPGRALQTYDYVLLTDAQGNPVTVNLSGQNTLRVTATEGSYNANYYMLVPAPETPQQPTLTVTRSGNEIVVSWEGTGFTLESTDRLPATNWTTVATQGNTARIQISGSALYLRLRKS